jgi:hypothetical protein
MPKQTTKGIDKADAAQDASVGKSSEGNSGQ